MIYLFTILYNLYDSTEHYFYNINNSDIYYVDISHIDGSKIYKKYNSDSFDENHTMFEYTLPQILYVYDSEELVKSQLELDDLCINKHIDKIIFDNI